jgi:predicted  nucleic acid-binding Zn-ribbon protein
MNMDCSPGAVNIAIALRDELIKAAKRIQKLEAKNAELLNNIKWMEAERDDFKRALKMDKDTIEQLQTERDAAVEALKNGDVCESCKHFGTLMDEEPCAWCSSLHSNFEWRGVQKEDGDA